MRILFCSAYNDPGGFILEKAKNAFEPFEVIFTTTVWSHEYLNYNNIDHLTTDDILDSSILNEVGSINYKLVKYLCEELDNRFRILLNTEDNNIPSNLIWCNFYEMKSLVDSIVTGSHFCTEIYDRYNPEEVAICLPAQEDVDPGELVFFELCFPRTIIKFFSSRGVRVHILQNGASSRDTFNSIKEKIVSLLRVCRRVPQLLSFLFMLYYNKKFPRILFTDSNGDLRPVVLSLNNEEKRGSLVFDDIARQLISTICISRKSLGFLKDKELVIKSVIFDTISEANLRPFFGSNATSDRVVDSILSEEIGEYLLRVLPGQIRLYYTGRLLSKFGVRKAICSNVNCASKGIFLEGLRRAGCDTFQFQHGGNFGYIEQPLQTSFSTCQTSHFLCYGKRVSKYLQKFCKETEFIPVGSPRLSSFVKQWNKMGCRLRNPIKKVIIFAPNEESGHWVFHPDQPFSTLLIWQNAVEIIRALGILKHTTTFVKLSENHFFARFPFESFVERENLQNITVIRKGTLLDFADIADIFVLNWGATAMIEALITRKPVVVYDLGLKIIDEVKDLLSKSVFLVQDITEFKTTIHYLLDHYYEASRIKSPDEFLELYAGINSPWSPVDAVKAYLFNPDSHH